MNKNLIALSVIVIAVAGGIYYFTQSNSAKNVSADSTAAISSSQQNQVMFSVDAKRWQFTPDVIKVKKGQKVKIIINNIDTRHGINLPDFNVSGNDSIEFTADKVGEFTFKCNTFCGDGHLTMQGKIIVTE
jgi:cytochrome c oxidase subunit 2